MTIRCLISLFAAPLLVLGQSPQSLPKPTPPGIAVGADFGFSEKREDIVYAVWVKGDGPSSSGGASRLLISAEANPDRFASVSLGGDYVSSLGMMWRSTAWIAAMVATQTAGKLVTDKHFVVRVGGHIDGPSAGMLMAATMLALINEVPTKGDVTMTGAINADGTVGPVGGIPLKIKGALEVKDNFSNVHPIKRFGYPAGSRFIEDPRTGKKVDLMDSQVNLGMEVVEIRDIYDAYLLLTGVKLERPVMGSEAMLALSAQLAKDVQAVTGKVQGITKETAEAAAKALSASKLETTDIRSMLMAANNSLHELAVADQQSRICEAMYRSVVAHALANVSQFSIGLRAAQDKGTPDDSTKLLSAKIDEMKPILLDLEKMVSKGLTCETIGGRTDALNAYLQFWECQAYWQSAQKRIKDLNALIEVYNDFVAQSKVKATAAAAQQQALTVLDKIKTRVVSTARLLSVGQSRIEVARMLAELNQREAGRKVTPPPGTMLELAKAYSISATANLELFNAMFLNAAAEKADKSFESFVSTFELIDDNYTLLRTTTDAAVRLGSGIVAESPDSDQRALIQLGSSLYALVGVTDMIQKNSAFGGRYNPETEKIEITNSAAISGALDLAKARVLEEASEVTKAVGFVPDSIKINFDLARSLQNSSKDSDRLTALRAYRRCFFLCTFARLLSGF